MSGGERTEGVTIHPLTEADEGELLEFEILNRAFFAAVIGDRGDDYFEHFAERHRGLVAENRSGAALLFVVRGAGDEIVGRVNLSSIHHGSAELGYRIAEASCGQGFARSAVQQVVHVALSEAISEVTAMTTEGNVASQRVLAVTGFRAVPQRHPDIRELNGQRQSVLLFVRSVPLAETRSTS